MPLRQPQLSAPAGKTYTFMPVASTYAQGKAALDEACRKESSTTHPLHILPDGSRIYRPLTLRENFQAQVEDFWTLKDANGKKRSLDDRLQLFTPEWVDSCTSVAYKGGTTEFTIIPRDENLITLPADFVKSNLDIAYPASPMVRLDNSRGKYNCQLTEQDVLDHEGWLAAMEGDQHILRERAKITFFMLREKYYGQQKGMSFHIQLSHLQDLRWALFVNNLDSFSSADSNYHLNDNGSFLRVTHRRGKTSAERTKK